MRATWLALVLAGCGAAPVCMATFTGNYAAAIDGPAACPSLTQDTTWQLGFKPGGGLQVSLDLGAAPAAGTLGSATASRPWRAVSTREPGCAYTAGTDAVPPGSFSLELTEVATAKGVAHGRLELLQTVHALPGADCGPGDTESLVFEF